MIDFRGLYGPPARRHIGLVSALHEEDLDLRVEVLHFLKSSAVRGKELMDIIVYCIFYYILYYLVILYILYYICT